jgi:thiol:disulfide interchange protein DsbA
MHFSSSLDRRTFNGTACTLVGAAALASLLPQAVLAQGRTMPVAGKDYMVLGKPATTAAGDGKIEVIEFFWYSCPHCFAFEPAFERWAKAAPADVVLRRVPVVFNDSFIPQQKLYYALEAMGKVDQLHVKVFNAIHRENQPLRTEGAIIDWVVKQGIDKKAFTEAYNSFSMDGKLRLAKKLQDEYKVEGVPAMGIAGLYYTDGQLAGNMDRVLQTTDALIEQERQKPKAGAKSKPA